MCEDILGASSPCSVWQWQRVVQASLWTLACTYWPSISCCLSTPGPIDLVVLSNSPRTAETTLNVAPGGPGILTCTARSDVHFPRTL